MLVKSLIFALICSCVLLAQSEYIYKLKDFEVPVDHFNFANNKTFRIRYLYNDTFVKNKAQAPWFFYTGNEGDIELFAQNTGFMWELAERMDAYVVFAEHRYYGKSLPFGSMTFNTTDNIGYLSVEQTLEDFAALVRHLRLDNTGPVIAFGGSYGGMLAAWFRMKYPHLVEGALAASAPIWQFNGLTDCDIFFKITTSVYTTAYNSNCSLNIWNAWTLFKELAASDAGRKQLNATFRFCDPLKEPKDIDTFFDYLEDVYGNLAMANYPYSNEFLSPLPPYPVRQFCLNLKDQQKGTDLLNAMQKALSVYTNYTGTLKCLDIKSAYAPSLDSRIWEIQTCNEIVMPMCSSGNNTMFRNKEWDFKAYSDQCYSKYKIRPRLDEILDRYGGKDLRSVSNIIFSNGLLDPWSGGGVLQAIHNDITVIIIPEGAHHLDLRKSDPSDPMSVRHARNQEAKVIAEWITNYAVRMHML